MRKKLLGVLSLIVGILLLVLCLTKTIIPLGDNPSALVLVLDSFIAYGLFTSMPFVILGLSCFIKGLE